MFFISKSCLVYQQILCRDIFVAVVKFFIWHWGSIIMLRMSEGPSWPWSYGSWIYNYLCNQCLSPLMLWVQISIRARCTTLCDKFCQWLATGRWFSPCPPVSSTNKLDCHDVTEILMNVALNTIKQTKYVCLKYIHFTDTKSLGCVKSVIAWNVVDHGFDS
jgi:hypothetical protein